MDVSYRYIPQDDKKRGSSDTNDVLTAKVDFENGEIEEQHHREFKTINELVQFDASLGVTDKLTLALNVPMINDRLHEHDDEVTPADPAGEFTNRDGTSGFGDITLMARYAILQTIKHLLVGGVGIKFASGEFELKDGDGTINEPTLMPGTGSYDAVISGMYVFSMIPGKLDLFTSVTHRFTSSNPRNYLFGDSTFVDGGVNYALTQKVNLILQVNSRLTGRDHFLNMPVPNTGLTFVNLTPGVSVQASENLSLYSHVQIPIYQRVNEANLVPSYGILIGASYGFDAL